MSLNAGEKPKFATEINTGQAVIVNADGSGVIGTNSAAYKTVATGATYGTLIDSLSVVSTDSVARNVIVAVKRSGGSTHSVIGVFNIPASSGSNGTAAVVDLLSNINSSFLPVNNQGKRFIRLANGDELVLALLVAATAATSVFFRASGANYLS